MAKLFASASRNAEFHNLFKNIPEEELLIDSNWIFRILLLILSPLVRSFKGYSCALNREILIHGRLYLSSNYICFNANLLGWVTSVSRWKEISSFSFLLIDCFKFKRYCYGGKEDDCFNHSQRHCFINPSYTSNAKRIKFLLLTFFLSTFMLLF